MSLQSLKLSSSIKTRLRRKIRQLITKGYLHPSKKFDKSYDLGFCMHIQNVPNKQFNSLAFRRPEGIRAFIQSGINVIAAADFLYAGNNLKLSHVNLGVSLKPLLTMLNKLEKKYSEDGKIWHAELIYFLLAPWPYILIKSGKKKQFYYLNQKKLIPISGEVLKKQINKILAQR